MAKFDESKDAVLASETFPGARDTTIEVKVVSYDNGEPKMQFTRFAEKGGESAGESVGTRKYMKLGRVTLGEAAMLKKMIDLLLNVMEDYGSEAR